MRLPRILQYLITVASGVIVVILGLVSNSVTDQECLTETENTAGRHCDFLHTHPAWFLAPAALVTIGFTLILLRRSTRAAQYIVVILSSAICANVLIAPWLWISTARHSGG